MSPNAACKLCLNVPKKSAVTKINALPKTFIILLEEMGGVKLPKADSVNMVICMKCLDFLKNMENASSRPKSNKIDEAGKKRVFKLMEKKRIPTGEAIEIVLAEQRAKELLSESGFKRPNKEVKQLPAANPVQTPDASLAKPRLSGAQRKKAKILIDGGMDPEAARQLVYVASLANREGQQANASNVVTNMQVPNQMGPARQRRPRKRGARKSLAQRTGGAQTNNSQVGSVAQAGKPKPNQDQKTPVQRVAPVRSVPEKSVALQKAPVVKKPTISTTDSPGILIPQNKRQNKSAVRPRGANSDKQVGPIELPRRNERPGPYNTNRQQNQAQRQQNVQKLPSLMDSGNFNQQQQRPKQSISFEVGIVPINYPSVTLDDLKLDALKEAITNEILKIPQGGPLIRFLGTSSQNGWLKVICADELSHNWLAMLVARWERAGVRMVEGNALPKPAIFTFYLQADFRSPDEILSIIEKQNVGLNTNMWRVINRESDGNGQMITVCVDEQCFRALQNRDFMVYLGLGVVEFKPRRSASDDNSSPQNFNGNDRFSNSGNNNMQGGRSGMGNNNYQSMNYGRGMNNGDGYNYQNQGQGYQRGGYQSQRAW